MTGSGKRIITVEVAAVRRSVVCGDEEVESNAF